MCESHICPHKVTHTQFMFISFNHFHVKRTSPETQHPSHKWIYHSNMNLICILLWCFSEKRLRFFFSSLLRTLPGVQRRHKSDSSSSSGGQMGALQPKHSTEPWRDFDRSETQLSSARFRVSGSTVNLFLCLQVEGVHSWSGVSPPLPTESGTGHT